MDSVNISPQLTKTLVSLWLTGRQVSRNLPAEKWLGILFSDKGNKPASILSCRMGGLVPCALY